jgi:pyridinium-3,5-bisthiocarboxylic acid mononucleotide nickel chelatase
MKILFIDPVFGISGDMTVSALIDAGVPFNDVQRVLSKVPDIPSIKPVRLSQGIVSGVHLEIDRSDRHFSVAEMETIIGSLDVEQGVKNDALGMLSIVVGAEAKVHGVTRDRIHFHELSHIDTIIDLVCVAYGIHSIGADAVYCGPVPCGSGTINTSHGVIPNPPPVTLEILEGHELVFYAENLELTTPTGAAIVAHYARKQGRVPPFRETARGYGVGTYESSRPDVLRILVGEADGPGYDEEVLVIETDIDDMEMEYLGAVVERIRSAGAIDVVHFPVSMKKGRTGVRLSVTADASLFENIVETIFAETTTFGLRWHKSSRRVLRREEATVATSHGPVRVKKGFDRSGKVIKTHIEFDDVKAIADAKNIAYREALEIIKKETN